MPPSFLGTPAFREFSGDYNRFDKIEQLTCWLFDDMTSFPFGEHDDLLDAAGSRVAEMMGRSEPRVWCGELF